ncbi:uncharacterized protein EDB91DRAFT_466132 [Suillus paluster]|uniref:uncharacterized protein n=1 Tax=Suillus paluster TaxID=48578 RepID=UPI001B864A4D|nr:uncharacterized protein EDB91DRAFT_466132 [Suillus paluster]KAG1738134.1 hypothetical protein EDB91DRAFT_466132 [Suillus paluster]
MALHEQSDQVMERKKCHLLEIVQYTCEPEELPSGEVRPRCFPLPRIFRICPDRPAVEITKLLKIDLKTGEIEMPHESSDLLPKGKHWRDIRRYNFETEVGSSH